MVKQEDLEDPECRLAGGWRRLLFVFEFAVRASHFTHHGDERRKKIGKRLTVFLLEHVFQRILTANNQPVGLAHFRLELPRNII